MLRCSRWRDKGIFKLNLGYQGAFSMFAPRAWERRPFGVGSRQASLRSHRDLEIAPTRDLTDLHTPTRRRTKFSPAEQPYSHGKGEYFSCLIKPRPARFDYFVVMSVDIARFVAQQKKLDELMKAHALTTVDCDLPVPDRFNRHQQFALNAGLLPAPHVQPPVLVAHQDLRVLWAGASADVCQCK
jgi:hypothetical protein